MMRRVVFFLLRESILGGRTGGGGGLRRGERGSGTPPSGRRGDNRMGGTGGKGDMLKPRLGACMVQQRGWTMGGAASELLAVLVFH